MTARYDMYHIDRCDALEYLAREWGNFPTTVPSSRACKDISIAFFRDWRFIRVPDGEIVFGNCISPGITAADLEEFKMRVGV